MRVGNRLTPDFLAQQIARLEMAWGAPRDRSPAQFVGMAREWFAQLRRFGETTVEAAFTHTIGNHKFQWSGALPEVVAHCVRDDAGWRDALGYRDGEPYRDAPEPFARDGRTDADEIAHRTRIVAEAWRNVAHLRVAPDDGPEHTTHTPAPASQAQTVSRAVMNSCAARRARKLPTCSASCAKIDCGLRRSEVTP